MERMASAGEAAWPRHEFTVDEVLRMVETGVLARELHVELLGADEELGLPGLAARVRVADLVGRAPPPAGDSPA